MLKIGDTVRFESRFLEPSISQLEPPDFSNQLSVALDIFLCNFTPDFSNIPISRTKIFVSPRGSRKRDSTVLSF